MSDAPFIPLSVPVIHGKEWDYVKDCLDTGWVSSAGSWVGKFEEAISRYSGSPFAVSTMNGTAALQIALLAAGVRPEEEVIVPTLTFIATANAVRYVGAEPVFMDCDAFLNIDVSKVSEFCSTGCTFRDGQLVNKTSGRRIRAILPVHVFGTPVEIEPLMELAERYGLCVIEDAAESIGSSYKSGRFAGRHTGTVGHLGVYSFNGNKIMTTGGGGMLLTADRQKAARARYLTTQAKDDEVHFVHDEVGYNYRMTNIQAALGCGQLELLEGFVSTKRKNHSRYRHAIEQIDGLELMGQPDYADSNFWFYSLVIDESTYGMKRDALLQALAKRNIQARPVWKLNHLQKPYLNNQAVSITRAPGLVERILNIPCSVNLAEDDLDRVVDVLRQRG